MARTLLYILSSLLYIGWCCDGVPIGPERLRRQAIDVQYAPAGTQYQNYDEDAVNLDDPVLPDDDTAELSPLLVRGEHSSVTREGNSPTVSAEGLAVEIVNVAYDQSTDSSLDGGVNEEHEHDLDLELFPEGQGHQSDGGQGETDVHMHGDTSYHNPGNIESAGHGERQGSTPSTQNPDVIEHLHGRRDLVDEPNEHERNETHHHFLLDGIGVDEQVHTSRSTRRPFLLDGDLENHLRNTEVTSPATVTSSQLLILTRITSTTPTTNINGSHLVDGVTVVGETGGTLDTSQHLNNGGEISEHHDGDGEIVVHETGSSEHGGDTEHESGENNGGNVLDGHTLEPENNGHEIEQGGTGHIAVLPNGEQHGNEGSETENQEHGSGTGSSQSGVDVPIDKGDNPHSGTGNEHEEPGQPRHSNNPLSISLRTTTELPIEPVLTTPKLIIMPTPAVNISDNEFSENVYDLSSLAQGQGHIAIHEGQNEHNGEGHRNGSHENEGDTEGHGEHEGQSSIHFDGDHGNHEGEGHMVSGEGHIESNTEPTEPETGSKPNKEDKDTEIKQGTSRAHHDLLPSVTMATRPPSSPPLPTITTSPAGIASSLMTSMITDYYYDVSDSYFDYFDIESASLGISSALKPTSLSTRSVASSTSSISVLLDISPTTSNTLLPQTTSKEDLSEFSQDASPSMHSDNEEYFTKHQEIETLIISQQSPLDSKSVIFSSSGVSLQSSFRMTDTILQSNSLLDSSNEDSISVTSVHQTSSAFASLTPSETMTLSLSETTNSSSTVYPAGPAYDTPLPSVSQSSLLPDSTWSSVHHTDLVESINPFSPVPDNSGTQVHHTALVESTTLSSAVTDSQTSNLSISRTSTISVSTMSSPGPDVTVPVSSMSSPGPDITVPVSTMSSPGPDVTVPVSSMSSPGPDVTVPVSSMSNPGPDVTVPVSTMSSPGPDVTVPVSTMSSPGPDVIVPVSTMSSPGPDVTLIASTSPYNNVSTSDMSSQEPGNATMTLTSITPPTLPVHTVSMTTSKKEHSQSTINTTTQSTLLTTKKVVTTKVTEKAENSSSTTPNSEGSSQNTATLVPPRSTSRAPLIFHTTQAPVLTTPPPVYIQISLRMNWNQFCFLKDNFTVDLQNIIQIQKQVWLHHEQFRIPNLSTQHCLNIPPALQLEESFSEITIMMYIVDRDGKIDITLTIDASTVIQKGFQEDTSSIFKDKIVNVKFQDLRPPLRPTESAVMTEKQSTSSGITMVIVIAAVGGVCCVALVILQVLLHRRVKAKKQRMFVGHRASLQSMDHVALGVIPKSRPNSGYWNPALEELPEPEEYSHIMSFSSLANFCMDTSAIHAEFQTIPFDNPSPSCVLVGEEDKNRFANVLPHQHSRVKLRRRDHNSSDYINANFINGYMGEKHVYIATQSPLVNTVEDFWRMIWEQQSRVILMLNPLNANGKPKQSTCYWPDDAVTDIRREFGDYMVTLKKRDVQHDYVDCTLEIMDLERNLKREVHHFLLTCWPDTGTPEPLAFVKFVLDTRPLYENSGKPVIIHCGPGNGRTGTLIAVDMCMRMFEDRRRVDILSCVHKMRSERAGVVQTREQYALIYQVGLGVPHIGNRIYDPLPESLHDWKRRLIGFESLGVA